MNNVRRKKLEKLIEQLEMIKEAVEAIKDEEQESFDNMPEGLQFSEKGESMEDCITLLDEVECDIEEVVSKITEVIE